MSKSTWNPRAKRRRKGRSAYDIAVERVKSTRRNTVSVETLIDHLYPNQKPNHGA